MTPGNGKSPVPPAAPDRPEVRLELDRILTSPVFRGSKRCQDFLSFVVSESLEGNPDNLKERTLAVKVFGRSADANLTDDSIVRVGAREVRKRLAQYYVTDGANDALRIELPAGSYVPQFHSRFQEPPPEPPEPPEPMTVMSVAEEAMPPPPAPVSPVVGDLPRRVPFWVPAASIILLASIALLVWQWTHRPHREFQNFWQPALDQQRPVLVAMADPIGSDAAPGQYVGFGDTVAAFRLAGMFAARSHPASVQLASKAESAGMRGSAMVLLGANRWTLELTRTFRYRFSIQDERRPSLIDAESATRRWSVDKGENGRSTEDYILICRIPQAESGGFTVVAAGLTQYGNEEAGRILTEPDVLVPLLGQLPAGWASKNVELVLHSHVAGDTSTPPERIASHVW